MNGCQKRQHNYHGLRDRVGPLQLLISAFVLLVFISASPTRGDVCILQTKNIKGTLCYSSSSLQNCVRTCQKNEFTEENERRKLASALDNRVDHIQFVQTWTTTPCGPSGNINCMKPLPEYYTNNFSMHGLWPAAADGTTLEPTGYYYAKPLPPHVFENIEADMNRWWANINSKRASRNFWEHEWSRHGVTGNWGEDGARDYFVDGIQCRQNIDLRSILRSGGIKFNTNYTKKDIVGAVEKFLLVKNVYISCSRQRGGSYYLYEIHICMDKITHAYISCPFDGKPRRCNGDFLQIPHT